MYEFVGKLKGPVDDYSLVYSSVEKACKEAGATVIKSMDHGFEPQGYTALFLLAESHAAVHTWPEHGYALVNYFSCAENPRVDTFVEVMEKCGFTFEEKRIISR